MALESPITLQLFTGEDKSLVFTIYAAGTTPAQVAAGTAVCKDIAGFALSWKVKHKATDDRSVISKTSAAAEIVISGSFNASPALNTQVATVTLTDDDLDAIIGDALYVHELKRTDAGSETVLSYGDFTATQAVHR